MNPWTYLLWGIPMAIMINAIIYGGVTWIYFVDKHRADPPRRNLEEPASIGSAPGSGGEEQERRLHEAA